jgi:biotin carboxyl carrier protein
MEKLNVTINGAMEFAVAPEDLESMDCVQTNRSALHVLKGTRSFEVEVVETDLAGKKLSLRVNGNLYQAEIADPYDQLVNKLGLMMDSVHKVDVVRSPMPGLAVQLLVEPGDEVKFGDALLILEAMKMENIIKSPGDGVVAEVLVKKGQAVEKGQALVRMS